MAGAFDAGNPVDLADENGAVVARGLVNYDAKEIPGLMGRSTRWLASKLGQEYEREVVHRDNLVVLFNQSGGQYTQGMPNGALSLTVTGTLWLLSRRGRRAGRPGAGRGMGRSGRGDARGYRRGISAEQDPHVTGGHRRARRRGHAAEVSGDLRRAGLRPRAVQHLGGLLQRGCLRPGGP